MKRRLWPLVLSLTALGIGLAGLAASASAQSVRGQVLEDSLGTAIAGARVDLLDLGGHTVQRGGTAQDGTFRLTAPRPGPYRLNVRRLGYAPRMTPPLDLTLSDTLAVAVRLRTAALSLAPVIVVGRAGALTVFNPYLESQGYYDREAQYSREGIGFAIFLDGKKLRPGASRFVDLLRDVPGIRIVSGGGTKAYVAGRWGCPPDIFVNGTFVGRSGPPSEDALPPAADIAAIEVYPGVEAPAKYLRFGTLDCGVIVLWTGIRR
jgi:hypothetical protein